MDIAALCACGSGLTRGKCCELVLSALVAVGAHKHLAPLEERALEARRAGADDMALALAIDILELAPGQSGALSLLYEIRKSRNEHSAAEILIRRLVALDPNNFWATNELTILLLAKGNPGEAELHARNAIRIAPANAQSHYLMGLVLTESFRPAIAEYHYRRALELSGTDDPVVLANMALCLKNQGKMEEARGLYQQAVSKPSPGLDALLGYARLEEADRNLDRAIQILDLAERHFPNNPRTTLVRATVLGRKKAAAAAIILLDSLERSNGELGPAELLEKGRLLDQTGQYDAAFATFAEGRRKLREITGIVYQADEADSMVARLSGFFTRGRAELLPRAGLRQNHAQPIFILGFPRSGTTLLEQILTAHSAISAGDELHLVHEIVSLMPRMLESPLTYPEALVELWMADHRFDLDLLRDHYLRKASQLGIAPPGARWFTDKMPLNEMHIGLISLMFPASPMIHLIRHPLDVVLSVHANLLTHGYFCAYDLESTARHYALIASLVEHYREQLDLRYLPVRYEDLVFNQAQQVARIFDFVGEPFEERCMRFHENLRYARTASYAQVAQPLYEGSCYRYKRYMRHLTPAIEILAPTIAQLGYVI